MPSRPGHVKLTPLLPSAAQTLRCSLIVCHDAVHMQKPYKGANGEPVYTVGKPFQRDQPASWDFLMENL